MTARLSRRPYLSRRSGLRSWRAGGLIVAVLCAIGPVDRVQGIFARENGQGAFFTVEPPTALAAAPSAVAPADADSEPPKPPAAGRNRLKLVK